MLALAKKLNIYAFLLLPFVASISSSIVIEVDLIAVLTIFFINLIPIMTSSLFAYFLLRKAKKNISVIVSVASPIAISLSTSFWYLMRLMNPVNGSPGIEHLAIPQMILIGALIFGLLSIILVSLLERKS